MIHDLGPRSRRIFDTLQARILSGELPPGHRLAPHIRLAADFGVAPMTMRHVLARLEETGLVSRELGRGTFVRRSESSRVLVLARPRLRGRLSELLQQLGRRVIAVGRREDAFEALSSDGGAIALVLCEVASPDARSETDFIRALRQRWPRVPVAVVGTSPSALGALLVACECPVLVVPTPIRSDQLEEVLRLTAQVPRPGTQLEDLLRSLSEPAIIVERANRVIVNVNPAAEHLLGYSAADALGKQLEMLIPQRVVAEMHALVSPTADPILDATEPIELPLVHAHGQELRVELVSSAVANGLVVILARDRTAQRTEHDALTFQSQLLEAVEQAVIATDPRGRILYWNRGAERLYGWSAQEVLGRNAGDVIVAPEALARGQEIMARLREGASWSGEFPVLRRDGTEVSVLVTDSPIRDADGRLVGIIGVATDLSERLERARMEALLLATESAQRALSQELALKVPSFGQLARDPRLPKHLRPLAGSVFNAVQEVVLQLDPPG